MDVDNGFESRYHECGYVFGWCSGVFLSPSTRKWQKKLKHIVDGQMRALTRSFEVLLKDRAIISAEMLHEYDEKVCDSILPLATPSHLNTLP